MAFASAALQHMQTNATGGRNPNLPSAVNSGLVGVTTNRYNNSYHHSKNSAPNKSNGAYTNRWPNDLTRNHPSINKDAVTGSDTSMNTRDMIKATKLFQAVFNDHSDPRRKYFAEVIGTLDGVNAVRFDFGDGSVDKASKDHTWHLHKGWWYLYWGSWEAADADLSVQRGETKQQYMDRHGMGGGNDNEEDDEMIVTAQVNGKATVWKGTGVPGSLMPVHSMRVMSAVQSTWGQHHQVFDSAQDVVDYCGTLPGNGDSVKAVSEAS
jgi:hypothetical protein